MASFPKVDIEKPKFDQNTFIGRAKHFFLVTNPLNLLATKAQLDRAQRIVQNYRAGKDPEVQTVEELWKAKYLYDSAFHPDTGEKCILIGRMSAQVPCNMLITGCMLTFYKTVPAVVFWQWLNQTFNAVVNYSNRSGKTELSKGHLFKSYCLATGGALGTALGLNIVVAQMHPLIGRLVPFAAIAAANCINIPMMRINELQNGIEIVDNKNRALGASKKAAKVGISAVIVSRIAMALPGMTLSPVYMNHLENKGFFKKYPHLRLPVQLGFYGMLLVIFTPLGCALFRQQAMMKVSKLEPELRDSIKKNYPDINEVYYNKGL